jgi:hypothetical protein
MGILTGAALLVALASYAQAQEARRAISLDELRDKIRGGWAAQMIGVSYGSVYEFKAVGRMWTDAIREWKPEYVRNSIGQDDLYVEMTFMKVLEEKGLGATMLDFGTAFRDSQYNLWHANRAGRENLRRGIMPPWSGHPKYNPHCDDIDFQIEADFIGLICPGMPVAAQDIADRVGRVMNYGDGLYGGMFVATMYAQAFFESDPANLVQAGLASLPDRSRYAAVIRDVLDWYNEHPNDWTAVWQRLEQKWGSDDRCPEGRGKPFNIDAKMNGAYVAVGLLYGKGDFAKTMEIATRCGQDADCNAASAAGPLGVILGWSGIADQWKSGIEAIKNDKFSYTDYSFEGVCDLTLRLAQDIAKANGGAVETRDGRPALVVALQQPQMPLTLEQWSGAGPLPDETE